MKMDRCFRIQGEDPEKLSLERMAKLSLVSYLHVFKNISEAKLEQYYQIVFMFLCYHILDDQGSPLVDQEGLALFGNGRHSRPVINPSDKYLTVGGKTVVGLDPPKPKTTTTTTTTLEPTTTETVTETLEPTTLVAEPTCPPGLYSRLDWNGFPIMDGDGILNCYSEGKINFLHSHSTIICLSQNN